MDHDRKSILMPRRESRDGRQKCVGWAVYLLFCDRNSGMFTLAFLQILLSLILTNYPLMNINDVAHSIVSIWLVVWWHFTFALVIYPVWTLTVYWLFWLRFRDFPFTFDVIFELINYVTVWNAVFRSWYLLSLYKKCSSFYEILATVELKALFGKLLW